MEEALHSGASSPLSSLSPSPEPDERRAVKRARLSSSSSSSPSQPLFLARHRALSPHEDALRRAASQHVEDLDALLDGLDDHDFDLPPSSDPRVPRRDESEEEAEQDARAAARDSTKRDRDDGAGADDSGIGLLPFDQTAKRKPLKTAPHDAGPGLVDEEEFEGDDMWLAFDDGDMGFDQPDAFPSSITSLHAKKQEGEDKSDGDVRDFGKRDGGETEEEVRSNPVVDLASFGFSTVQSANSEGGFFFATRKPFVPSAKAIRHAQARFGADPFQLPVETRSQGSGAGTSSTPRAPAVQRQTRNNGHEASNTPTAPLIVAPKPRLPPANPTMPSVFGGFQNGAGRSIAAPSEEALRKAQQRYVDAATTDDVKDSRLRSHAPSRVPSRSGPSANDLFGPRVYENDSQATYALQPLHVPSVDAVAGPSREAGNAFDSPTIARTRSFTHDGPELGGLRSPLAMVDNVLPLAADADDARSDNGSSTATLTSSSPHKRANSPIGPSAPGSRPVGFPEDPVTHGPSPPPRPPALPPNEDIVGPSDSMRALKTTGTRSTPALSNRTSAFRSPMINSARTAANQASSLSASTPLRPSILSTGTSSHVGAIGGSVTTPLFNRRLNIGMTPRNKPFHLANTLPSSAASSASTRKTTFKTPFKGGKRPEGLTPMGLKEKTDLAKLAASASMAKTGEARSTPYSSRRARLSEQARMGEEDKRAKVFDLQHDQTRFDLFNFGMRPQTHFFEELETSGIPEEILSMTMASSKKFIFACGRSVKDAFESLRAVVASRSPPGEEELVTVAWVENHWSLILWKLACYVRTRPDLLDKWWSFELVMDQLRYRYEREINRAQRSAIKRIQERDSPASLPMILCVSQLLWDDPPDDGYGHDDAVAMTQVIVGVELTDGWYRIRAQIDPTLKSACERGKLIVGSKLAITGARLDKFKQEGVDVLEALGRSKLVISGNSTSLAPWHATLGFCRTQFFASLDSLSSAGGIAAPLDIVIDKIFELGYVDAATRTTNTGTWGEAEERERALEWEKGREKIFARMADAADKEGVEDDDLVALLQEAVQGACEDGAPLRPSSDDDLEDPEEVIERIERSGNTRATLRKVSPQCLEACLAFAVERAHRSRKTAYDDLKEELDKKYPPRQTRSVRMMRVRDAREKTSDGGLFEREAILTVWDVKDYASDFFREGKRYVVTNTIAKGNWQRKHKEITLHTKKDSKWTRL